MASRRIRAFKRWMKSQGIECSDALAIGEDDDGVEGICVKAVCDLKEGDLVATIPKHSCLTIRTSGARDLIESSDLDGILGLTVALMYERSLSHNSPWFGYLQLLPHSESIPLLWSLHEIDSLLSGTELHKTVREDKALVYEDWKQCILPLTDSATLEHKMNYFTVEEYFAAKSLVASRSFEIDDFHGPGMVPLADLFNHKTGDEDVHFTDNYADDEDGDENEDEDEDEEKGETVTQDALAKESLGDEVSVLEMIMVKNVKAGDEVFNTYGTLGNAGLLHRCGFTEEDNINDIVNIDVELVLEWSSSLFSTRHSRSRLSFCRRRLLLDSEYFEISYDGEPQDELLVLLYIILLPDETYRHLDLMLSTTTTATKTLVDKSLTSLILLRNKVVGDDDDDISMKKCKDLLLTKGVCEALLCVADIRENLYGANSSLEEDIKILNSLRVGERKKMYHSMMLRVSERKILATLRTYAAR